MTKTNRELLVHYFLKACKENNTEKIMTIIKSENFNINSTDQYGHTGLHIACYHGNPDIVNILVKLKADVNFKNINGETPLMYCCGFPSKKQREDKYPQCEYF